MRYFLLLSCGFLMGCNAFGRGADGTAPVPGITEVSLEDADTSADIVPDETEMRPAIKAGPTRTIAGLGDPSRAGLWLETPLVTAQMPGRVTVVATGATTQVTLMPLAAEETAGSFLSLAAMRALNASLSDLVELQVATGG